MKTPSGMAKLATSVVVALALGTALATGLGTASAGEGALKTVETKIGKVLADANSMTLYVFDKDTPGKSNCYGKCAKAWPPIEAGANSMASGRLSIVMRTDGSRQWAYDKMPLYGWFKDKKPGDVTGDGLRGVWHVVRQ